MSSLSIGLSGLLVDQRLLDLTGQNITNANTPNYHQEVANLAENVTGSTNGTSVGAGVSITNITRNTNQVLQEAVNANASADSNASTLVTGLNQLQSYLAPGTGSLEDTLTNLFSQMETLTSQPDDPTQRQVVVSAANAFANQLNEASGNIDQLSSGLITQAQTYTNSINTLTSQIAQLNQQIHDATIGGFDSAGLLDQRDQAVASLANLIDITTVAQPEGEVNILAGGVGLVLNSQATTLTTKSSGGSLTVSATGATEPLNVTGGQLGGTLALYNTTIPGVNAQLQTFTQSLATQFNEIQATGLGLNGPMTESTSQNAVADVNQPLASANLPFPAQAGNLYIDVTDLATGQRTLNQVQIDPQTQSLANIATAISAVPNVQAVVNAQTGTLSVIAAPGYGFDFTGNLSTSPDQQSITGTTSATIDGAYTGTGDDTLHFTFQNSGTIGSTPNLTLQVTNSAGAVLGSLNVGQGYTAGADLPAVLGVQAKLAAGTAQQGDSFSVNVTANPDSANLLSALGLNTFFTGNSAGNLSVNSSIVNDPNQLATSTSGQPGDDTNLAKFVALQTQPVLANNTQSLQTYINNVIGSVGTQASDAQTSQTAYDSLGQQLTTQLQNATGVDSNQALMQLVQYQQAYQMSAQYVTTVSQTFSDLMNILSSVTSA